MKKNIIMLVSGCTLCCQLIGQTVTLYPDKDALIDNSNSSTNYGSSTSFAAEVNKPGGDYLIRSLMEFDLSSIPDGAVITAATLYLYGVDHYYSEDPTDAYLEFIDDTWEESEVSWDEQPSLKGITPVEIVDVITTSTQDVTIEMKSAVSEMYDDPSENNGFMLILQDEEGNHARLGFASSDHATAEMHPKLVVTYAMKRFASLKPELDGSYYEAYNGELRFKYLEEYIGGTLKYNIYDDFHNVVFDDGDLTLDKTKGTNWFFIDITTDLTYNKYYVLEVFDENNRSSFLRFHYAGSDTDNNTATAVDKIHSLPEPNY